MSAPHRPADANAWLELRDITKDFPGVRALDGVSFDLERGEIHALCGENGAGKSTLIKILCGLYPSGTYGGEVRLDGRPLRLRNVHAAEAHGIALIAQELALVPGLSVEANIVLGREPVHHGRIDRARVRATACAALERVGLDVDPTVPVRLLGIAQQQLVEIAKALAKESSILVLDEPTAALAAADTARLLASLGDLRRRGVASILVSHRLDEVFQVADRVTVLRDGRSIATAATAELPRERVIALMVGREIGDLYPHVAPAQPHVRLAVRGWSVEDAAKPGRDAVAGVEFDLHAGEILAIAGLVGAGRTALLTSLYGAARARVDGTLELEGGAPRPPFRHPAAALAAGIALVTEDRKRHGLIAGASVADNVALAGLAAFVRRGVIDTAARDRACAAGLARVQAAVPDLGMRVAQLSGGNQQKVVLGRALLGNPRILLLDEPTRGIDVGAKSEIYRAIADLAAAGMAILLVTSELPELLALAHRILVLNQGRPAALLDARQATAANVMHAATRSAIAGVPAASGEVA